MNERGIQIPRWFYWGQTGNNLGQLLNQYNARLTRLRVQDSNTPTFAVTKVRNTNDFGSAWWWYYDIDAQTLGWLLEDGKRLISIDPYPTS